MGPSFCADAGRSSTLAFGRRRPSPGIDRIVAARQGPPQNCARSRLFRARRKSRVCTPPPAHVAGRASRTRYASFAQRRAAAGDAQGRTDTHTHERAEPANCRSFRMLRSGPTGEPALADLSTRAPCQILFLSGALSHWAKPNNPAAPATAARPHWARGAAKSEESLESESQPCTSLPSS